MKKISLYVATLALSAMALQSCDDNWELPPMDVPTIPEGVEANMTIAELKTQYWQESDSYGVPVGLTAEGDSIILRGTVVSSDESGNIYKQIVLQDASGAVTIGIDEADLFEQFPMGMGLAVNVSGMTIGKYNGLVQLGKSDGSGVNRIALADFSPRTMLDFYSSNLDTTTTTIAELNAAKSKDDKIKWQSRLIRIDNVHFAEAGKPFTTGSTTSRNIVDADGNRMIVYNSSYSDFAYELLPNGNGSVVGILSCYRDSWQILLIDAASCFNFDGEAGGEEETPAEGNAVNELNEKFTNDIPANWTQVQAAGNKEWYSREFDGISYATMTGYQGTAPFDQWLVSPAVDMDKVAEKVLSFRTQVNGYGSKTSKFEVYVMTAADTKGTNTLLNPTIAVAPASGYSNWVSSGNIDLSAYTGKVYIGFRYSATEDANYATWCVTDILLGKKTTDVPETPDNPETPAETSKFLAEDAENGADGWTFDNVNKPASLDYIWNWKAYSGKYYLNGSAYKDGAANASEAWAISPEIELKGAMSVSFDHAAKFQTTLKTACGFAVREVGATEWTMLTIPTWPEAGSWTFVNSGAIDLSAYAGKKIQLAFKYGSTAAGADTWEIKNMMLSAIKK